MNIQKKVKENIERHSFEWIVVPGCKAKLVAAKEVTETIRDGKSLHRSERELLVFESAFKKYMNTDVDSHLDKKIKFKSDSHSSGGYKLWIASPEFLKDCAEIGVGSAMMSEDKKKEKEFKRYWEKPFTILKSGVKVTPAILRMYDHTLRYVDDPDKHYPGAVRFDYIEASMHNKCYSLKKVLKILSKKSSIRVEGPNGLIRLKDVPKEELENHITPVPWYNNEDGRREYIEFWWQPTQKEMDVLADSHNNDRNHDKFKVIFDNDMLGLRKGGAAKFKTYYGEYNDDED